MAEKRQGRRLQTQGNSAREAAALGLLRIERAGAYSHLVLSQQIGGGELSPREQALAKTLLYGVLERRLTLDAMIAPHCDRSLEKLDDVVRICLRMGAYQLAFLEGVQDFAAVSETVELCKRLGCKSAGGFVNGVLRSMQRKGLSVPKAGDTPQSLSLAYSCPLWLVDKWIAAYGWENTKKILAGSLGRPPLYVRVNTLKTTSTALRERLLEEGVVGVRAQGDIPDCLELEGVMGGLEALASFREGLFHVQDAASQRCVQTLAPKPGERILDLCAAPGGKSFTIAQYMENQGELLSRDLQEKRVRLIRTGAERLGLTVLKAATMDAGVHQDRLGMFHRVLCDVPCSGFGSMRRKPEVKYKQKNDIKNLPTVQEKILKVGANYVQPGGYLLYSTCTLLPEENQEVVGALLASRKDFRLVRQETFFGGLQDSDGFYTALLLREV